MDERDPYEVLDIGADASSADIARAYRRNARAVHPDSRPGDPAAAAEFRAVSDAYRLLSDPVLRSAYDSRHGARAGRRRLPPAAPAEAGPALWAAPPAAVPGQPVGPVHGAYLRAGPVRIDPLGPAGSSRTEPRASPVISTWLAWWLLDDRRRSW